MLFFVGGGLFVSLVGKLAFVLGIVRSVLDHIGYQDKVCRALIIEAIDCNTLCD